MKNKLTILTCLWLLLMGSLPSLGNTGEPPKPELKNLFTNIASAPAPGFTYTTNGGCVPVVVQFYSQMSGPAYAWTFGDGGVSSDCNPVHTYTTPGVYTVTLVATGGTYTTTITVGANPVVTIVGDSFSCQNDVKNYTATSTIPAASYSWVAQGGIVTASTATTATVTWSSYGVNYLNYTITTAAGCTKVFTYKVRVLPPPTVDLPCCDKRQKPDGTHDPKSNVVNPGPGNEGVPGGSEPCSVCAGSYDCYTATIDPQFGTSGDYTWTWTVTNGTIVSLSPDSTKACVVWGSTGVGTIKLVIEHKIYHCITVKECEVTINPGITPVFTVSGNCINTPVFFDATGTTPLSDVESFFWEYGDGYTETTASASSSHEFAFVGNYTATLTITTYKGCTYKVSNTFHVGNGTRPTIVCPGTVCEGSRQCYSTTYHPGASYAWVITGDIPADQTISTDGNEICVTWGTGPVGTVKVTVTGGPYTCTPTTTEAVAIVSTTFPIAGPDFICQTAGFIEVSTANYTGACYKWTINGTLYPSATTNVLQFNAGAYGSPITIDVDVDFPLGCCHGHGKKVIKKIPQYTMLPYVYDVCIGDMGVYTLLFPAGNPSSNVSWSVEGGTIITSNANSVTIQWNTVGIGTITAGNNTPTEYCNDGSNNTWQVKVWDKATGEDISGPPVVCATNTYTYYHGYEYPTGSVIVTAPPGCTVVSGPYSSDITFPGGITVPTTVTISVTYKHAVVTGCDMVKTYDVVIVPNTIPTFSIPVGPVCQGDIKTYTSLMADDQYYEWEVIGGSIVSETFVPGLLTIQVQWNSTVTSSLTIKNKACGTSSVQPIVVNGKPVVIITPSPVSCTTPGVTLSVAPIWTSYAWTPTGSTSPTTLATTVGTYNVTVSNGVCSNTGSIYVPVVSPGPPNITGFTVTPPTSYICPRYDLICPTVIPGTGTITSYNWSFSGFNVGSSSAVCPSVALPSSPGLHTGTWFLTVTDEYGCYDTMSGSYTDSCTNVIIPPCSTAYTATFAYGGYDPCTGQFTTTATNYNYIFWDFGDGTTGSGPNPIHKYATACNKNATCIVYDLNNCAQAFPFTVSVPYTIFNPTITVANSPCTGASTLTTTGIDICLPSALTPSYTWVITPAAGGPAVYTTTTTSNVLNVTSLPIPPGDYTATVTLNIIGTTCSGVAVKNFNKGGLIADFVSCGGCVGSPVSFTDQSTPYSAPIIQWVWTVTGPPNYSSFLQNPTIDFTVPGSYNVNLTITDNALCTASHNININILPPFMPGDILVNGVAKPAGTTYNICPEDVYVLSVPAGGVSQIWSNGATTASINVTEPGEYSVTMFDAMNCAAKIGPIKFFFKPAPEATILASADQCSPRLLRAFTGTGYSYMWNYPISLTSTAPYINLYNSGLVSLKVTNLHGCSATTAQTYNVFPSPSVYISPSSIFCPGSTVTLTANVSGGTPGFTYLWNNSLTTPSINTTLPGLFKVFVKDANGCKAQAELNLQPVLPSGMDKLPYGCYDVCGPVAMCSGTMPYGWTGQWYLGASTYGGVIPQGGNINTTFSSSGTYTLHYTPVNPLYACPAISKPITINITALPTFTITPAISPAILCIGSGQSILLTANPQSVEYTYTWWHNGGIVGTGYTYSATEGGTYTLEIKKNDCCKAYVDIVIEEGECCFENANVPFTSYLTDYYVSGTEFWFDKYYINATIYVNNAQLDLTNVDCVFGPMGRIEVQDQGFLRCNNSVLRPCEKDDIWQGVTFTGSGTGWINTTTIKNATVGVDIISNYMGVRLTDNTFIKCQTSVSIQDSYNQQSISGNTFEIDETHLNYPNGSNDYFAIYTNGANMKGLISQNDFRQVEPRKTSNRYFGIYSLYSTYTASENRFNDMYRAVDVMGNWDVIAYEKNDFKLNNQKENYDVYQVRISQCQNPVLMYENKFDNGLKDNSNAGAIYIEDTYRSHIKDNTFNGFYESVHARRTTNIHIASNTITSNSNVGIAIFETSGSMISCNNINSRSTNASQAGGPLFGVADWFDNDPPAEIYANCIFNMNTSIYMRGNGGQIPNVYNNYLYNYKHNGVFTDNYFGSIGNPGGATAAGRNTFMSNNGATGTTFDINSTAFINEGGNFGILMTNNVGSTTGPEDYYSTAACGQQIQKSYPNNQLDKYNICDAYELEEWIWTDAEGNYKLKDGLTSVTRDIINEYIKEGKTEIVGLTTAKMRTSAAMAEQTGKAVIESEMNKDFAATLVVYNSLAIGAPQLASTFLASPELSTINADLRLVLATTIELDKNPVLTGYQRMMMTAIDDKNDLYSPMAREILQSTIAEHDYKFKRLPAPELKEASNPLVRSKNELTVYPVPSSKMVSVDYVVRDAKVQAVKVVSSIGAEVANFSYTIQAGTIDIDISALAPGIYSVVLVTDSESKSVMTGRFIKLQ